MRANKGKQVVAISGSTECGTTPCITMARERERGIAKLRTSISMKHALSCRK